MGDLTGRLRMLSETARAFGPFKPLTRDEATAEIARLEAWIRGEGWNE